MGILEKIFPRKALKLSETEERAIADSGSERARRALASDEHTSQEILYFLAEKDPSPAVRKAVATNPSTPLQASPILAMDGDEDIRLVLAGRLMKILPDLSQDKYSQLYAFAVQSLGMLALDEVLKIRKALAETLKDHAHTPPAVAAQLARAVEREVSEPILRFCVALSDDDIVDILQNHPANWAAEAVAGRKSLSNRVSRAVFDTGNTRAGAIMLANEGANIAPQLLEMIVEQAREYPEWHKPLAMRKTLPPLMAMKLAAYVDGTVKKILLERTDLDAVTIGEITAIVKRRGEFDEEKRKAETRDAGDPVERAKKLYESGDLNEEVVSDAIAMNDRKFVLAAMAYRARTTIENIEKVLDVRAPKSICAVTWKAGYSARLALKLQQTFGRVPPASLIYPRGGTDYPIDCEVMKAQLEIIGIE